jgi:predicted nucleotidyltransferase component of viral defense system
MFEEAASKNTRRALDRIAGAKIPVFRQAYLAGGTALALQLGHRFSFDLDFFSASRFDEQNTAILLRQLEDFTLEKVSRGTIFGKFPGVRFTLFFYRYPLVSPLLRYKTIRVADIRDIAAMKIAAIADRGTKRDFIDLYCILTATDISLVKAFQLYNQKFRLLEQNKIHIMKSLSYFVDAEKDAMPKMIKRVRWTEVKKFFWAETKKLVWC